MHVVAAGGAAAGAVGAVGAVGDVDEGAVAASVAGLWAGCKSFAAKYTKCPQLLTTVFGLFSELQVVLYTIVYVHMHN